ncbi:MAG: 4Fe-4S dicluster domain-containing protein [Oceanospirillaceae bacterium]|nr:4Fe-4S dicluster domain-containing protein [Oceanospirillaceae bacterium]
MDQSVFLPQGDFGQIFERLREAGYRVVGPAEQEGALTYDVLESADDIPVGLVDRQAPGHYRLEQQNHRRRFDWVGTAQGLKPWLFVAEQPLWVAREVEGGLRFEEVRETPVPTAVIGVRACDLAALALQDRHFLDGDYPDPHYRARRESLLLVAVNCHRSADTCFCVSTGDGPEVTFGADLVLDELDQGYLVKAGSERGAELLARLPGRPVRGWHKRRAKALRKQARTQQRALPSRDLRGPLYAARDDMRHWQPVAERCLTCGNCAAVCPTCFCHRVDEESPLDGSLSRAVRRWDTCFNDEHSYLVGHVVRKSAEHKYRQWLTHKLAIWHDQYDRSGCTGCGRCITWCPVGIDIVEEAERLCREVGES